MDVLSRKQAAKAADISERTLDRLYIEGKGAPRIQLSERRVGYDAAVFVRWLKSRSFSSQAAALAAGFAPLTSPGRARKRKAVVSEQPLAETKSRTTPRRRAAKPADTSQA